MAMAVASDDAEHFVNCGVCFCEFDEETRKPKFLQCAHTVCLKCLKKIWRAGVITCPFCRKTFSSDAASLPNNSYALQMVKFKETTSLMECRAGGSIEISDQTKKLTAVLKKRKGIQEQLNAITKSITAVGVHVKKLQEENNIEMAKLISLIEVTPQPTASTFFQNPISPLNAELVQSSMQSSIFILKVFNNGTSIGEIRIRPASTFHPEFVQQLGQFCYKSPKTFASTVDKAQAGVFVSISMSHTVSFQPTLVGANQTPRINASKMGEVGIIFKKKNQPVGDGLNTITGWNLFIPLNPANNQQRKVIASASAELFGHIVDISNSPNKALTELSTSKKDDRRNYSMTLESQ